MGRHRQIGQSIILFIKGLFMGSADIIPGVSGGTVALITGIYERFIAALHSINIIFIVYFFKGFFDKKYLRMSKQRFLSIDFSFLVPLALGIIVAFLSLANVMSYSLDTYPTYTFAFFFGLILASSVYVYLSHRFIFQSWVVVVFVFFGFVVSFGIVGIETVHTDHSLLIVFLAGIISICAMILPGISGAFILLMIGQYGFMLDVLRNLAHLNLSSLPYAISFALGGLIGLLGFSRILSYLLKKYHMHTLSLIIGLMIGALRKPGEYMVFHPENISITISMVIVGMMVIGLFGYYEFAIKSAGQTRKDTYS